MRAKWFFLLASVLTGFLCGYAVYTQRALQTAPTVYGKREPLDPRALFSGDYMQLNYDFERPHLMEQGRPLVLQVGENNKVLPLTNETEKTAAPNDVSTNTQDRMQPRTIRIKNLRTRYRVPHQFYFQEGTGKKYENAAYAKVALLENGTQPLPGLPDDTHTLP